MRRQEAALGISIALSIGHALLGATLPAQTRHAHTDRPVKRLLPLPQQDDCFFFLIYGDRTGGKPEGLKVLRQAVADSNLLAPDLVMTVGDLIQGYNRPAQWQRQAAEFSGIMNELSMPWFPVAGNHDVYQRLKAGDPTTNKNAEHYEKHFGPLWYWFEHKRSAFVVLYSDEGDPVSRRASFRNPAHQKMSPQQFAWLDQTLRATAKAEHVFVFLHHPRWRKGGYGNDWERVHQRLKQAGNVTAVFAGHIHQIIYGGKRDGIAYYTLATTGGGLNPRLPATAGFLHHFNLVTVRKQGIKITTIPVGAVMDPELLDEATVGDVKRLDPKLHIVRLNSLRIGAGGAVDTVYRAKIDNPCGRPIEVTLIPQSPDHRWRFTPDHRHKTIAPGQSHQFAFGVTHPDGGVDENFRVPAIEMQIDYLGSAIRINMPKRSLAVPCLPPPTPTPAPTPSTGYLSLDHGYLRASADTLDLTSQPLTALTVECYVRLRDLSGTHGLVAGHGFRLRIHQGRPVLAVRGKQLEWLTLESDRVLEPGQWHHLAGVFGAGLHLYVDGQRAVPGLAKATLSLPAIASKQRDVLIGAGLDQRDRRKNQARLDLDEVRLSTTVRYRGSAFRPVERLQGLPALDHTALLLHFDQNFGPWIADASRNQVQPLRVGQATCVIDR